MDQMLVWTLVHHELTRQFGKPPRNDDAFYAGYIQDRNRATRWTSMLWPARRRGR